MTVGTLTVTPLKVAPGTVTPPTEMVCPPTVPEGTTTVAPGTAIVLPFTEAEAIAEAAAELRADIEDAISELREAPAVAREDERADA